MQAVTRKVIGAASSQAAAALLLLIAAAALSPGVWAQEQNDHLIVPWKRIGPIALGMSAAEATRVLGSPRSIVPGTVEVYNWDDLSATITKDKLWVTQVCTFDPDYATIEGIHAGSTDFAIADLMHPPKYSRVFNGYWRFTYSNLYWPGLMMSVHLKGYATNHAVWKICVNHFAAIVE